MATQSISGNSGLPYALSMDSTGVAIIVAISMLSLMATLGLLLATLISAVNTRKSSDQHAFVRSHVCAYFLCLLICWVGRCVSSVLDIQWLADRMIYSGQLCTAQGALKHVSEVGIAVWTIVIACHNFCVLYLNMKMSKHVLRAVLVWGWTIILLLVVTGSVFVASKERGPFYDVIGRWCWIAPAYTLERILLAYLIMLLSALSSTILYIVTYVHLRGGFARDGWKVSFRNRGTDPSGDSFANDPSKFAAKQMLLYPLIYAILLIPIAVTQFISWAGKEVPFIWDIFSVSVYMLFGITNVVLFATNRRMLPTASLRLGNSYLVPGSRNRAPPPLYGASAEVDKAEKGTSKTVTFAAQTTVLCTPPGHRDTKRPASLDLARDPTRDSMNSMYSAREGVYLGRPLMSSQWSPDTPPIHKVSRLSVYLENITVIANKI